MNIRGEMTFGKWTLSGFVRSRSESLWWFEVDFWPLSVHFRRGPITIFRKHKPSGMGTESLGMMGCIFAENGPLEGGIESSFCGTGWGDKGDFTWIFGPNPCIFEGGPHHFPKAHALRYGHRKFGSDRMYIRGEWALRRWHWIKFLGYRLGCSGWFHALFIPIPVHFRIENPYLFRKQMPWAIRTAKLAMIRWIFVEKWPLESEL